MQIEEIGQITTEIAWNILRSQLHFEESEGTLAVVADPFDPADLDHLLWMAFREVAI